jgi:hypothetical protein
MASQGDDSIPVGSGVTAHEDVEKAQDQLTSSGQIGSRDLDDGAESENTEHNAGEAGWDWSADPDNPYNWPTSKKAWQVGMISAMAFLTYVPPVSFHAGLFIARS